MREKALAVIIEGGTLCCYCAHNHAEDSGFPYLVLMGAKVKIVDADSKCHECDGTYGRDAAEKAAKEMTDILKGKDEQAEKGGA